MLSDDAQGADRTGRLVLARAIRPVKIRHDMRRITETGSKRLAQIHCGDSEGFAVLRNGAPRNHETLFRQQFGNAAV
ncbi:hypothetical protein GCM10010985_11280 [Caballeronia grimmiae]|uniref:Transposase n=1 Tax=Caballeronia grimmiae TaxID=1071679 RepID=A0ABQ1R828_9BURK|nr:hypothetical protein GCM10010985_11280 [Caballeronia grimmiae]